MTGNIDLPPSLEYAAPADPLHDLLRASSPFFIVCLVAAIAYGLLLFCWVPHCRSTFMDFHTTLPLISTATLDLCEGASGIFGVLFLVLLTFLIPIVLGAIVTSLKSSVRRVSKILLALLILSNVAIIGVIILALELPMLQLMDSVRFH